MKTLTSSGLPIAYADEGKGKTIILAHCSSASHRMWQRLIDRLKVDFRVLAPDLSGYGQSALWPADRPFDPGADAQILVDLAGMAEGRVHFVGHSYGGAMALEAVRRLGGRARGMTLIEPVAFPLLRAAGRQAEWTRIERLIASVNGKLAAGDKEGAASAYMGFWLGRLNWWLAPRRLKENIVQTIDKVGLEFQAARDADMPLLGAFRSLDVPALLIQGSRTRKPAKAVVQILAGCLPDARVETIAGAGHMSPVSHRDSVFTLVRQHIEECAQIRFAGAARPKAATDSAASDPEWERGAWRRART
ncbi:MULTISPECIES: alpha/beta hydrolase [Rhodomicrobium]|uniref:alpha/beta fold hydrolase n=1 Tax=Rhodomicrobium TaxID=1068 RepID=UPI000B4BED45|nr:MULTISPECIES: alpha/beta hydrolase [Rhodomicrobium]